MSINISVDKGEKNDDVMYAEWVPAGKFVKRVILFVCILIISLGIIISVAIPEELAFIGLILVGFSAIIFLIYWNYRGLQITLTNHQLEVNYGIFNHKRIHLTEITNCEVDKAHFRTYGGVGIRYGFDGSWAYNTDFGKIVKLTLQNDRPFAFSTKNPERICNLINEKRNFQFNIRN